MNFTLKQLRAFVYVANAGSFTDAAKKLHVTQSALSLLVRELEKELGVHLLDRSTRQTTLSVAGADFYPFAVKVLDDLNAAVSSTLQLQEKQRGSVRLACTPLYAATLVPELLTAYRLSYPAVRVQILDSLNEQVLHAVANGEAELGIAPQRAAPPELLQEGLFDDAVVLVVPRGHKLCRQKRVTWEAALTFPFITLTQDFTARLQADLHAWSSSLVLQPTHSVSYLTTALGMVKNGHGVTALPSFALPLLEPFGLTAVRVEKPFVYRQVSLFSRRAQSLSPAAQSFRDFLEAFIARRMESAKATVRRK